MEQERAQDAQGRDEEDDKSDRLLAIMSARAAQVTEGGAEHAVSIDFVNYDRGVGARVAVELTAESARELVRVIEAALSASEAQHLPSGPLAAAR